MSNSIGFLGKSPRGHCSATTVITSYHSGVKLVASARAGNQWVACRAAADVAASRIQGSARISGTAHAIQYGPSRPIRTRHVRQRQKGLQADLRVHIDQQLIIHNRRQRVVRLGRTCKALRRTPAERCPNAWYTASSNSDDRHGWHSSRGGSTALNCSGVQANFVNRWIADELYQLRNDIPISALDQQSLGVVCATTWSDGPICEPASADQHLPKLMARWAVNLRKPLDRSTRSCLLFVAEVRFIRTPRPVSKPCGVGLCCNDVVVPINDPYLTIGTNLAMIGADHSSSLASRLNGLEDRNPAPWGLSTNVRPGPSVH